MGGSRLAANTQHAAAGHEDQPPQQASAASGGAAAAIGEEGREEVVAQAMAAAGKAHRGKRCWVLERAHRLVALAMWGPTPAHPQTGQLMEALHMCHQPRCVNPAHLMWHVGQPHQKHGR